MNIHHLICFDTETSGLDTSSVAVIQLAAIAIDFQTLKPHADGEFNTLICPDNLDEIKDTEDFLKAQAVHKKTTAEIAAAPPESLVWKRFAEFCKRYKNKNTNPSPAGKNIRGFDLPIVARYCEKYKLTTKASGKPNLFHERRIFDVEDDLFRWFGHTEELRDFRMDNLREYLGISGENSHDAHQDVLDTALVLTSFLAMYRKLFKPEKFRMALLGRTLGQ